MTASMKTGEGCDCACHKGAVIVHVVACCGAGKLRPQVVTAAKVTAGGVVELACGCVGQRATTPVSANPQFLIKASCDDHAPNSIVEVKPDDQVTAF